MRMPHLRFRAVKNEFVKELSAILPSILAPIMATSEDNFTFECIATEFYAFGKPSESYPFIEVLWFARNQTIQNECALVITEKVKLLTRAEDVVVVFTELDKISYYENGNHF